MLPRKLVYHSSVINNNFFSHSWIQFCSHSMTTSSSSSRFRQVLKTLCSNNGWTYGLLWRLHPPNPFVVHSKLLTLEDTYYEEQMEMVINNMLQHVHMLEQGIIGRSNFTGMYKWITSDTYCGEWNMLPSFDNQDVLQDNSEFQLQFSSGIKTILLVSVTPQCVVQFGSTQKILERIDFVDQVRTVFLHLESTEGMLHGNASRAVNPEIYDDSREESSIFVSGVSSNYGRNKPLHDGCGKELMGKFQSFTVIPQFSPVSLGYQSSSTTPSIGYSFHLKNQLQTAGAKAQVILSTPNMQMPHTLSQFTSCSANSHASRNLITSAWNTEGSTTTSLEHQILSGLRKQEPPSSFSKNSQVPMSCGNTSQIFQGPRSLTSYGTADLPNPVTQTEQTEVKRPNGYNLAKLVDNSVSAPFHGSIEGEILQGAPTFHTIPQESKPLNDMSSQSKPNVTDNLSQWVAQSVEQVAGLVSSNENLSQTVGLTSASSELVADEVFSGIPVDRAINSVQGPISDSTNSLNMFYDGNEKSSNLPMSLPAENDLFDSLGLEFWQAQWKDSWEDIILQAGSGSRMSLSTGASECISELDVGSMSGYQKGFFTDYRLEQLLEGVIGDTKSNTRPSLEDQVSTSTIVKAGNASEYNNQVQLVGRTTNEMFPESKLENAMHRSQNESGLKSRVSSWIDDSYSISSASAAVTDLKRPEEPTKSIKKRARPGESTRPRPKDRQQIQDRVKELREIVPNSAKCSIDSLLDRTIKHMLFLQSVTKYADKLKQVNEPMMIGNENSVVLKDALNGGGASYAFEVGSQTMVCPMIVEDLSPPGQMLVEILCEDRGYFLEIADIIRGFGLTILKGLLEIQGDKIWARFIVEASRSNITRMDIFLSLVQLLQQTTGINSNSQPTKSIDGGGPVWRNYQKSPMPFPAELADQVS